MHIKRFFNGNSFKCLGIRGYPCNCEVVYLCNIMTHAIFKSEHAHARQLPHPRCFKPIFSCKKTQKTNATYTKCPNHHPNFKTTHQNVTQTRIASIPCKSPNLPQPTYLPPQLQLPVCCHVTVLGPKCPSILAILRLINSTLPMYMLARGTWIPPPRGDPGKVFFGRDLVLTEGKNSQAVVGCI